MKTRANRLGIYTDVKEVADLALAHNGGEYRCETHGHAVNFTQRFYRFRKLFNEVHHADGSPCIYDRLILPRVKPGETIVLLHIRQQVGTFAPATRTAIDITTDDELFDLASSIAKKLKGVASE